MLLKEVMKDMPKQIATAGPAAPLEKIIDLIVDKNLCCLPVVGSDGKPVGMVRGLDVLSAVHRSKGAYTSVKVKDVMKTVVVGKPTDDCVRIADLMEKARVCHIPVVKGKQLIGMISLQDIYRAGMKTMEIENRSLTDMLDKRDKSGDYDIFDDR